MNKKQMFLFALWVLLVVGLVAFAIIYIIFAQIKQTNIDNSNMSLLYQNIMFFKLLN